MKKLLIVIVILVIAALAILMMPQPEAPAGEVTTDESAILEDIYIEMLNEEMDVLLIEQTEFNSEVEDSIASDMSQFYYD